ncbi:hypothetical protein [Catenovulum sediminis]|uniref:GATA-type domain-containing protein n=1 Tax=Catenovulum sediminis TaxID=1740262 RepID=A0ABV1RLA7_9ALTE|nr:hypothetical protein [Catenovulum sediminis]
MLKSSLFSGLLAKKITKENPDFGKVINYRKILTRSAYLKKHPTVQTEDGIACCDCGELDIKEWGLLKRDDIKRVHSCNFCGQLLFRTIDRMPANDDDELAELQ